MSERAGLNRCATTTNSQLVASESPATNAASESGAARPSALSSTRATRPSLALPSLLAAVPELYPTIKVNSPLLPPSRPRIFGMASRPSGPNKTSVLNRLQPRTAMSTHAPMRAHHSRSSSEVTLLATPMKMVAVKRNSMRNSGAAKQPYNASPAGRFAGGIIRVAAFQRKMPPTAPVMMARENSQRSLDHWPERQRFKNNSATSQPLKCSDAPSKQ